MVRGKIVTNKVTAMREKREKERGGGGRKIRVPAQQPPQNKQRTLCESTCFVDTTNTSIQQIGKRISFKRGLVLCLWLAEPPPPPPRQLHQNTPCALGGDETPLLRPQAQASPRSLFALRISDTSDSSATHLSEQGHVYKRKIQKETPTIKRKKSINQSIEGYNPYQFPLYAPRNHFVDIFQYTRRKLEGCRSSRRDGGGDNKALGW